MLMRSQDKSADLHLFSHKDPQMKNGSQNFEIAMQTLFQDKLLWCPQFHLFNTNGACMPYREKSEASSD